MKLQTFILFLCCVLLIAFSIRAQQSNAPPPSPLRQAAIKILREMPVKLHDGTANDADLQACAKILELAPNDNAKRPFYLLIAQYQRLVLQKSERTLLMLVPHLLGKDKAKEWQKENDNAVKLAKVQWLKDEAAAKKAKKDSPKLPSNYIVDLPPLTEWKINEQNSLFAVEAAHCLAALDQPQRAIEIIDAIGQKYEDETRVLAAECGADLFIRTKLFERSVEFYKFALNVLETLKKQEYNPGKGNRIFFTEEQKIIHDRLVEKLHIAERLYDEDRFGPDWVEYREAQKLHFDGKYLEAYFAYLEIVEKYRGSIYGEAATCYLIEILTKLADKDNIKNAAETFKEKQKELNIKRFNVKVGVRAGDPETMMNQRRDYVAKLEKSIALWKNIPLGENAITAVEKYTEQFIERDKYGLYRGEAMLDCGLCWLETFLDPEKAEPWLLRANEWFNDVKKTDFALMKLEVPDKSKAISQAPMEERFTDEWTNVLLSKPKPGDLFNRRECKWYLDSKVKEVTLWLGFIFFTRNDWENAKSYWKRIAEIDKEYNQQIMESRGTGTISTRLLYFLETQPGILHASKDELKAFKDKRRFFAVCLGDCAYVAENRILAQKIYRKLDEGFFGYLSKNEKAYVTFAIFDCLCWEPKKNETEFLESRWGLVEGTPSEKRALIGLANRIDKASVNYGNINKRLKLRNKLIEKFPNTPEAEESMYRSIFEMMILVYDFENIEKYLNENGPDNLLAEVYNDHKIVQSKIFQITDRIISCCNEYNKKYKNGRFSDSVTKHLHFVTAKKSQFALMEFYRLP